MKLKPDWNSGIFISILVISIMHIFIGSILWEVGKNLLPVLISLLIINSILITIFLIDASQRYKKDRKEHLTKDFNYYFKNLVK